MNVVVIKTMQEEARPMAIPAGTLPRSPSLHPTLKSAAMRVETDGEGG
jgi:hypothetical protein